ncbi:MAG: 5'/3'-nucleotidase SurE [Lachnospiraceae bacterium]
MKPVILITNDDGIQSPGLLAMAEAVKDIGELLVIAPRFQQTSMGRAFPRVDRLGSIEKVELKLSDRQLVGYSIVGSPAYAAAHGILELALVKPTLCLSGINYGENMGTNLTCSGTVGAVLEADTHKVPGIAFSIPADIEIQRSMQYADADWRFSQKVVRYWTEKVLQEGMKLGSSMLNINIPEGCLEVSNYRYTRQSKQNFFDFRKPPVRGL